MLADLAHKPAQHQRETGSHNQRWKLAMSFFALIVLIAALLTICYNQLIYLHQPVKYSMPENYAQYVHKVKQRYKKHLPDVAQSFWLPADMHTFIQLSLTSQDKPRAPIVDENSADERIVSERSLAFNDLLSEIDAGPGSRIIVRGQPGIGKTTLLQMITRYWAHDRALSSCWILLHIVLRDLVLLQHAPDLTTFLSFMETLKLPPDIETFVLDSDGKGLCFIADGLDEYPAGYENITNFIFSELIGGQKPNIKLPQSTVVISSRPEVASKLRDMFDKHVEVLGFGDDQINEYVQAKYGEDKSFSKYLDDHLHIKHTCYIPLHLAMLVYLKDSLLEHLPETETEIYEQFIIHTLNRDFCKNPTSSCSRKNTLPTSLNNVDALNSLEIVSLLFHIANLSYNGIQNRRSIFKEEEVESVLQHTNSSLLVVERMNVHKPTTYSFPHLTIQEFLAAFYFNTYLERQEQERALVEYSKQHIRHVFWKFCCGLKRNENQTTFLEFFNLLYQSGNRSHLPYHCAHEARSPIASQQLITFTKGIAELNDFSTYYDVASFAYVAVSAAQSLVEIKAYWSNDNSQFLQYKLCDATVVYSQLRKVVLDWIYPSNIGCLLQKSPNLESLSVTGFNMSQSEDAAALVLPPNGTTLLNIRHIHLSGLNIGDKGVEKLSQLLQDSINLETLLLRGNGISDDGASAIADLMKTLPHLQGVYLNDNHIGDKGVAKLSLHLRDSLLLATLSLSQNGIGDNGASAIADLMKALPRLQRVLIIGNHIGGTGAALLWNQSIPKCCSLSLDYNVIGDDRPDVFISALNGTINNGYERNRSCQLKISMLHNKFLCSDLRDIHTISKKLPKGVTLKTGDDCLEMFERTLQGFKYCLGENHHPIKAGLQWIFYTVCTFHIFYSTRTLLWGLLYFCCCLSLFILSPFNYLVQVDHFSFIVSLLWSWMLVGRLIFCVSLKLLFKPRCWVLIPMIAVMVKLYSIDFKLIDYQFFVVSYIGLISGYILYHLRQTVLTVLSLYLLLKVVW